MEITEKKENRIMDNHNSDAMELTMNLVRIDSTDPGAYEGEIGEFIFQYLKGLDVPVIKKEVLPGRFNVMARLEGGGTGSRARLYICHMDTVTTGEGWTVSPFGAEVIRGRIYGRGACDMKSGLACALSAFTSMALKARDGQKPKRTLVFIGTVDEEDFMRGAEAAIADGWVTKDCWVLDTEPTNGRIEVAHKGRTWFEITVKGITAHASTPWKGARMPSRPWRSSSPLYAAGSPPCPVHPDLGASTVTFGQIEGGYRPYVVPGFLPCLDRHAPRTADGHDKRRDDRGRRHRCRHKGDSGHHRSVSDHRQPPYVEKKTSSRRS